MVFSITFLLCKFCRNFSPLKITTTTLLALPIVSGSNMINRSSLGFNQLLQKHFFLASSIAQPHGICGIDCMSTFNPLCMQRRSNCIVNFCSSSLESRSIIAYLLHIQSLINSFASIGDLISRSAHINLILDGLPDEYRTICTFLNNSCDPLSLDDVTPMLLAEECSIEKCHKKNLGSLNFAEGSNSNSTFEAQVH